MSAPAPQSRANGRERRLDDGRRLWRFRGDGYLDSPPLIAGRRVFVGSGSGRVYGLALGSGRVRWRADAGAPVEGEVPSSGLAAAEGILVVPAQGRVVAFG